MRLSYIFFDLMELNTMTFNHRTLPRPTKVVWIKIRAGNRYKDGFMAEFSKIARKRGKVHLTVDYKWFQRNYRICSLTAAIE